MKATAFLPDGYLKINAAYDVGSRARSTPEGAAERKIVAREDEVVMFEMAEGVTVITSGKKLSESLRRMDPDAVEADGTLRLGALRERGEATRGILGDVAGDLVSRVFTLTVGDMPDPIIDAAKRKAAEWLGEKVEERILAYPELGVSWLGTKALMWAIENQLDRKPGLCRWPRGTGQAADLLNIDDAELAEDAKEGPLLVFLHGRASSSTGVSAICKKSFPTTGRRRKGSSVTASTVSSIAAFSQSPIDNAVELAAKLPRRGQINLMAHSRGA